MDIVWRDSESMDRVWRDSESMDIVWRDSESTRREQNSNEHRGKR